MGKFYWDDMTTWRRWWHATTEEALFAGPIRAQGDIFMSEQYWQNASDLYELRKQCEQTRQELWERKGYRGLPAPGWKPEREKDRSADSLGALAHIPHHERERIDYALNGYETVLDGSVAVNKEIAYLFGRGAGEGRLIVTDQNLLHVPDSETASRHPKYAVFVLNRGEIATVARRWIPIPTMSELVLRTVHGVGAKFYLNTKAARRIGALLKG